MATKKQVRKSKKAIKHEIVISVSPQIVPPTISELTEPMKDGKKLTIPKTWLSDNQIVRMVQQTPKQHVYRRAGRGGKYFDYVTGSYVIKVLNFVFGWNWDFEVIEQGREADQIWVKGRLVVKGTNGETIVKTQYGRADVKFKQGSKNPLDYGNDLKAAATDSLKKCASMLGIASDIYGKTEFKEEVGVDVQDDSAQTAPKSAGMLPGQIIGPDGKATFCCSVCNDPISEQTSTYSLNVFGKRLCKEHQAEATPLKKR